jgi:hypothetical protein
VATHAFLPKHTDRILFVRGVKRLKADSPPLWFLRRRAGFGARVDHDGGVGTLVRVDSDHHCCHGLPLSCSPRPGTVTGMPNSGAEQRRPSFEPRHGEGPAGPAHRSKARPQWVGRRFGSQACRTLSTLRPPTPQRYEQLGGSRSFPVATSGIHPGEVPGPRSVWPPSAARLPSGSYLAAPAT